MNRESERRVRRGLLGLALICAVAVLPAAAQTDAEIEECLGTGKVVVGDEVLPGLTGALKIELDCEGRRQRAVFKSLSVNKPGLYKLADGSREFNFTDKYQYERAAYLLDRELGLDMVPVAVLRTYQGKDGTLVAWIHDAVTGRRVSTDLPGTMVASLERQKSVMRLFDALIYNVDRRPDNYMVNESTGKLYLIDHGRSFRIKPELQSNFADNRVWMSEDLYTRLQELELDSLTELTKGLIFKGQVKALLNRRDLILEKIDRDREEYGDESVFLTSPE
jgi:hypothetical protein